MKKVFSIIVLLTVLAILMTPAITSAQEKMKECCKLRKDIKIDSVTCTKDKVAAPDSTKAGACDGNYCADSASKWGMFCIMNSIYTITDWLFMALVAIVVIIVLLGAYFLITAAGEEEKTKKGKNYVLYAVIGFIVALLAKAIPTVAKTVIGI